MFEEIEKQKVIQHYERVAEKRHRRRSASSMNICKIRDEGQAKCSNILRSTNTRREVRPFSLSCDWKTSPVKFKQRDSGRHAPIEHSKKSVFTKSTAELSDTPKKSCREGITEDLSIRNENFKRTVSVSPKPKFRRDLFVIPEHTCRKKILVVPIEYKSLKPSHWQNVRKFTTSPSFKYSIHRGSIKQDEQYDPSPRDFKMSHKEEGQKNEKKRFIKAPIHDLRKEEMRSNKPPGYSLKEEEQGRPIKPPVYELKEKGQKRLIKSADYDLKVRHGKDLRRSPRSGIKHVEEDKTNSNIKNTKYQKGNKSDTCYVENQIREASRNGCINPKKPADKPRSRKNDKSKLQIKEPLSKSFQRMEQEISSPSTEESDGSSQTKFFSLSSDYEIDQGVMRQNDHSSSSSTSVYSAYHYDKYEDPRSKSSKNFKPPEYHQNQTNEKKYRTENQNNIYEVYNVHEISTSRGKEAEKLKHKHKKEKEQSCAEKLSKRKQTNPSKIVHFEDSEEEVFSKKNQMKCSPKRSYHAVLRRPEKEPYEIAYCEESLEDYIKRKAIEEHKRHMTLMKYIVNKDAMKEYREKYANNSTHPHKKKSVNKTEQKNYDYKLSIVDQEYHSRSHPEEDCEACAIERLLAD